MRKSMCRFRMGRGKALQIDGAYFSGAREIYCRRVYFAITGFDIWSEDISVDLGANVGLFTTLAASRGKKVISIEAQSGFIPMIGHNLRENHCSQKASVELGIVGSNKGLLSDPSARKKASHWVDEPRVLSLPELFRRHSITRVDFLKVDIEGSEFDLFSGDIGWLRKVEKIAMEVHPSYGEVSTIKSTLENAGFRVWLLDANQRRVTQLTQSSGYVFAKRLESEANRLPPPNEFAAHRTSLGQTGSSEVRPADGLR